MWVEAVQKKIQYVFSSHDFINLTNQALSQVSARDGDACAFSRENISDKCHWWPYSSTKNPKKWRVTRKVLRDNLLALNPNFQEQLMKFIVPKAGSLEDRLAASDAPWNMVTMSPGMHRALDSALFALKWLGATGETIKVTRKRGARIITIVYAYYRVQWFWLPPSIHDAIQSHIAPNKEKLEPRHCVRLDSEEDIESLASILESSLQPQKQFSPRASAKGKEKVTARDEFGRSIETGRVFQLKVDQDDLEKTKAVIEAQWLLSRMAAFSGASEVWDQLDSESPSSYGLQAARYQTMPTLQSPSRTSLSTEDEVESEHDVPDEEVKSDDKAEGKNEAEH